MAHRSLIVLHQHSSITVIDIHTVSVTFDAVVVARKIGEQTRIQEKKKEEEE